MEQNKHEESYSGKVNHLRFFTEWEEETCEQFIDSLQDYLREFVINDDEWFDYNDNDLGKQLLDMALHYNKKQGVDYKVEVVKDEYDDKVGEVLDWINN